MQLLYKTFALPVISLLCFTRTASAQTAASLQNVIDMAIKKNPTLEVYAQQITQARYNYSAAKGVFYPNAGAGFTVTDNLYLPATPVPGELVGRPGTTYYTQFGKRYAYNTGVSITQNIVNWQAALLAKIACNNVLLAQSRQAFYIQSLKEQVARAYYAVLVARESVAILSVDARVGDSLVGLARQRFAQGTGDALAINQATITANNVRQNMTLSQQVYDQGIASLKDLTGTEPSTELYFSEPIDLDSLGGELPSELGPDKSLGVYLQQLSVATLQRRAQLSSAYPVLVAGAYFGVNQYRDDFAMSFAGNAWSGNRNISLSLNVPLFTGLGNTYRYMSSKTQQDIAQLQYEAAVRQSRINDQLLERDLNDFLDLVRSSSSNYHLYEDNLRLNEQKYAEGIIPIDIYLRAFQDYLAAENTYMSNLSQLLSVRATIFSRQ